MLGCCLAIGAVAAPVRKLPLDSLRPTQYSYGADEVALKRRKLERIVEAVGSLGAYKREHPGQIVLGPGGEPYLVDGHHLARALLERGSRTMFVEVLADWSYLDLERFAERMVAAGYCYLRDRGVPRPWEQLPRTIDQMTDDAHRTLAWLVREAGGYRRLDVPYQEFAWAEFLRHRLAIHEKPDWNALTTTGVALAQSDAARGLPGWSGKEPDTTDSNNCASLVAP
mgnify:CR=1 FL=1